MIMIMIERGPREVVRKVELPRGGLGWDEHGFPTLGRGETVLVATDCFGGARCDPLAERAVCVRGFELGALKPVQTQRELVADVGALHALPLLLAAAKPVKPNDACQARIGQRPHPDRQIG